MKLISRKVPRRARRFSRIFGSVRRLVGKKFPSLRKVRLFVGCPEAEKSHSSFGFTKADKKGHSRLYAHWGHVPDHICTSSHMFIELHDDELAGMLLHEFGHAIADLLRINNTQDAADGLIWKHFRIPIYYRMPRRIQYVDSLKPQKRPVEGRKTRFQNFRKNPWYIGYHTPYMVEDSAVITDDTPYFTEESALKKIGELQYPEDVEVKPVYLDDAVELSFTASSPPHGRLDRWIPVVSKGKLYYRGEKSGAIFRRKDLKKVQGNPWYIADSTSPEGVTDPILPLASTGPQIERGSKGNAGHSMFLNDMKFDVNPEKHTVERMFLDAVSSAKEYYKMASEAPTEELALELFRKGMLARGAATDIWSQWSVFIQTIPRLSEAGGPRAIKMHDVREKLEREAQQFFWPKWRDLTTLETDVSNMIKARWREGEGRGRLSPPDIRMEGYPQIDPFEENPGGVAFHFSPFRVMRETEESSPIVAVLTLVAEELGVRKQNDKWLSQPFDNKRVAVKALDSAIMNVKRSGKIRQWPLESLQALARKFFELVPA